MLHRRQAPGRDFHKHFSLAPARGHTMTASNRAKGACSGWFLGLLWFLVVGFSRERHRQLLWGPSLNLLSVVTVCVGLRSLIALIATPSFLANVMGLLVLEIYLLLAVWMPFVKVCMRAFLHDAVVPSSSRRTLCVSRTTGLQIRGFTCDRRFRVASFSINFWCRLP